MTKRADAPLFFASMREAATATGIAYAALQALKEQGLPGFERSGRVDMKLVLTALFATSENGDLAPPPGHRSWREALNKVQTQRQEVKLQLEKGRLIERALVAERIQRAASEAHRFRTKSENEHALLFAGTSGDPSECRTILRGIWDEIFATLQSLSKHFEETHENVP